MMVMMVMMMVMMNDDNGVHVVYGASWRSSKSFCGLSCCLLFLFLFLFLSKSLYLSLLLSFVNEIKARRFLF